MRKSKNSLIVVCQFILCSIFVSDVIADDQYFKFSGFGTLSVTHAGDDDLYFRRDLSQEGQDGGLSLKPDSLLGMQFDTDFSDGLSATIQLVAKERPEQNLGNSIEWAFLDYDLTPDWHGRAGRMALDLYLLSEYRNVGFAYLWARAPVEFYGSMFFSYFDGVDATFTDRLRNGVLQFKLFGGQTENDLIGENGIVGISITDIIGTNLSYETNHWKFRISLATGKLDNVQNDSFTQLIDDLSLFTAVPGVNETVEGLGVVDDRMSFYSIGWTYDRNKWTTQLEIGYLDSEASIYLPYISGYLSVGHRFDAFTVYGLAASVRTTDEPYQVTIQSGVDPLLDNTLVPASQKAFDSGQMDQHSLSIGARWDVNPRVALKAQWDRSWVKANEGMLWIQKTWPGQDKVMDILTINANVIF